MYLLPLPQGQSALRLTPGGAGVSTFQQFGRREEILGQAREEFMFVRIGIDVDVGTMYRRASQLPRHVPHPLPDLIARDKASLDIFWLKDDSLEDSANLPNPDILAQEIVDDLEAALERFRLIANDLGKDTL